MDGWQMQQWVWNGANARHIHTHRMVYTDKATGLEAARERISLLGWAATNTLDEADCFTFMCIFGNFRYTMELRKVQIV